MGSVFFPEDYDEETCKNVYILYSMFVPLTLNFGNLVHELLYLTIFSDRSTFSSLSPPVAPSSVTLSSRSFDLEL